MISTEGKRTAEISLMKTRFAKFVEDPQRLPINVAFPILRILSLISRPLEEQPVHRILADEGLIRNLFILTRTWMTMVSKISFPIIIFRTDFLVL